jgi:ribulose-5-phosphate 4-epimerase/fuculose-1-phosphate aldolase
MSELDDLHRLLRIGARMLFRELRDPWGHVAVRLPKSDGRDGFLLKYIRALPPPTDPETIYVYDYDGNRLEGDGKVPWEIPLYTETFKARPDAQAVIHMHPRLATALTQGGKTIFALSQDTAQFERGVAVVPGDMVNTVERGAVIAEALGRGPAVLMKGHGAVTVGASVPHAVTQMLAVEQAAQQQVWAATVGTPQPLDESLLAFLRNPPADVENLALWYTKLYFEGDALEGGVRPPRPPMLGGEGRGGAGSK